ncbi:MAG: substrate-binding domain-containing protein [Akkermansiaceae bacterium]
MRRCLDSLFANTPPTALIVEQSELYVATQQNLLRKGTNAPEDVSMICADYDLALSWCHPSITHPSWDEKPLIRRIACWANSTARGKSDRKLVFISSRFIEAGIIGSAKSV